VRNLEQGKGAWAACFQPEYDIWEELLKEAYGSMVEKLSKYDREHPTA